MKATGEVMAIDRTFGSALNKALRGLEQAGVGPLAEDPDWAPTLAYLAAALAAERRRRRTTGTASADDAPIRWVDADGQACESTRHAERTAAPIVLRRFLAPSDTRLWRVLALLRRGVPEATIHDATGINPWFLAEFGRAVGLERDVAALRCPAGRPDRRRRGDPARRRPSGPASAIASWPRWPASSRPPSAARVRRSGSGPGYAMVDTCAAEFAAETPYFYATYAAAGSPPEAPPVARPAALVIGSGPVRIGQGIEFDYCAVQAAESLRGLGWSAVMINSNPETVSTDFDASSRLYFEPLDPESVLGVVEAETAAGRRLAPGVRPVRRPDPAQPGRARWPRPACRCSGPTSRRSTSRRSGPGSPPSSTGSGSPSRRAGWPTASRRR